MAEAQFSLGLRYASGNGAAPDYVQAEHWYRKAAGQNHALASFNLGMMNANGHGMPADRAKALVWIQRAADLGDAGAQFNLGSTHHRAVMDGVAENVSQSRIDAYKWFCLAAAQGYQGAAVAGEVVNLYMSRADVMEGCRRIAAFHSGQAESKADFAAKL